MMRIFLCLGIIGNLVASDIIDLASLEVTVRGLERRQLSIEQEVKPLSFEKSFSLVGLCGEVMKRREFADEVKESLITYEAYTKQIEAFKGVMKGLMADEKKWVGGKVPDMDPAFAFIAQKVDMPSNGQMMFWGDVHGDVHSLVRILSSLLRMGVIADDLTLRNPKAYLVFLGDYVDRGKFGAEVLYVLMQLKIKNPDRVYVLRGNHDDYDFNIGFKTKKTAMNFHEQLKIKFPGQADIQKHVYSLFAYLPEVIYFMVKADPGIDVIQACHGAFELGYNPKAFLNNKAASFEQIHKIDRKTVIDHIADKTIRKALIDVITEPHRQNFVPTGLVTPIQNATYAMGLKVGFSWHEFIVNDDKKIVDTISGKKRDREIIYGKKLTEYLMKAYSTKEVRLRTIMRGHQHHDPMLKLLIENEGFVDQWDFKVITLFSSPANYDRGIFMFDATAVLLLAPMYDNWQFKLISHPIPKEKTCPVLPAAQVIAI